MNKTFIFFIIFFVVLLSCRHEPLTAPIDNPIDSSGGIGGGGGGGNGSGGNNCDPNTIYFQQQVLPILISNCTMSGCHDAISRRDGVNLTTYNSIMSTADVRPGSPFNSKLYKVLVETDRDERMPRPPASPLTDAQKAIIYKWIQQGAKNLSCQSACDTSSAITFTAKIKPILEAKCTGCHGGSSPQAGINLTTHAGVKAKVTDGRLWGAINHQTGFSPMPKNGNKLSDCELSQIKKWIDAGSLNN